MSLLKHMERWEDVKCYEGLYQVSNCGRVKSLNYKHTGKENILAIKKEKNGYLRVNLCKDGNVKTYLVHRLVAQAFIPNPLNLPCVNHKNENKEMNFVWNLEWCDSKYNVNYGTGMRRMLYSRTGTRKEKKILCVETGIIYNSAHEAERNTGIINQSIIKCCRGKYKSAGKLHWQYA